MGTASPGMMMIIIIIIIIITIIIIIVVHCVSKKGTPTLSIVTLTRKSRYR